MHTGVDLIVAEGTPVHAARSGVVVLADSVAGYGLTVLLDHRDGWQTLYAHLRDLAVQPGQRLGRGEVLGWVGATGRASTPHLHLELRRRGAGAVEALDPQPLLEAPRPALPALASESGP
jgi:murein DD-endopeptidase MepM/ murein hydrolase activator NlpD